MHGDIVLEGAWSVTHETFAKHWPITAWMRSEAFLQPQGFYHQCELLGAALLNKNMLVLAVCTDISHTRPLCNGGVVSGSLSLCMSSQIQ